MIARKPTEGGFHPCFIILDQVVTLHHHADGRSATLHAVQDCQMRAIGVLEYNHHLDAYTSSIDRDPRSLAEHIELLVRWDRRKTRAEVQSWIGI